MDKNNSTKDKEFHFEEWKKMYHAMNKFCKGNDEFAQFCKSMGMNNSTKETMKKCATFFAQNFKPGDTGDTK